MSGHAHERHARTVTASGWPYQYRARIERHDGWRGHGWRYILEEKWVHWSDSHHSCVYKTEAAARAAAGQHLDALDRNREEREYV